MTTSNATRIANTVTVLLVAAITLAAIVGVIYGVTTHEEPGIAPSAVQWPRDRFPLEVCPEAYVGEPSGAVRAVADAIGTTNDRLDFPALVLSLGAPSSCDITITVGVPAEPGWMDPGGDARFTHGPRCEIRTSNTGTNEILHLVLQHEIGHCLGLAHDPFETSIMREVQTETPDRQFPPRITDDDRALLRTLYGPPG